MNHVGIVIVIVNAVWVALALYYLRQTDRRRLKPPASLQTLCVCGHPFGVHRSVPHGAPSPCRHGHYDDDPSNYCPCQAFEPQ